jgi:hypothetical protein
VEFLGERRGDGEKLFGVRGGRDFSGKILLRILGEG